MNIRIFDIQHGVYLTRLERLRAEPHQHPATEIIVAEQGEFRLTIDQTDFEGVKCAVIESNVVHALSVEEATVDILLLEHRDQWVKNYITKSGFSLGRYYIDQELSHSGLITSILEDLALEPLRSEYDERVQQAISLIQNSDLSYFNLKKELNQRIFLSESRLAHLFKENTGISIKKYYLWCKLKQSVYLHVHQHQGLLSALLDAGFYDQPHFSKAYKASIGLSPGKVYNSRIVQENADRSG